MSSETLRRIARACRPAVRPVARVIVIGGLSAGVVLGSARLGPVPSGPTGQTAGDRVAATSVTTYCPGDPFTEKPEIEVTGSVSAHDAPGEVLEGLVAAGDEPGSIAIDPLAADPAAEDASATPPSGPLTIREDGLDGPVRVRATQDRAPGVVAGQSFVAEGDRATGLAALPCSVPTADAWLVSGGAEQGRQERLVLTNPGGNAVSVRIEALGAEGEESVVVPPREKTVVLLDAIGGTDTPQAVHVTSSGGLVVPTIVDHHLDGLTPAGVETSVPTVRPSTRQVIPAVVDGDAHGMVIGVPGQSDAVVQVRSLSEDGSHSATVETLPAGRAVDIDLPDVPGVHSWLVESDEPVVAAAHLTRKGADGTRDMAWSVATRPVGTLGGAALPTGPGEEVSRRVAIAADEDPAEAEVLTRRDGRVSTEEVSIEAGHSVTVDIGAAEAVWVRPTSGSVHAAGLLIGGRDAQAPQAASLPIRSVRVAVRDLEVVHVR